MKRVAALIPLVSFSAFSHAQECKVSSIEATTPVEQFVNYGSTSVKDASTGLIWSKCSLGQTPTEIGCTGSPTLFTTWKDALLAIKVLNDQKILDGVSTWRMPNIKELDSIVERQCNRPSINYKAFPDTPSVNYLSSTPYLSPQMEESAIRSRNINFLDGTESDPVNEAAYAVRPVRDSSIHNEI